MQYVRIVKFFPKQDYFGLGWMTCYLRCLHPEQAIGSSPEADMAFLHIALAIHYGVWFNSQNTFL